MDDQEILQKTEAADTPSLRAIQCPTCAANLRFDPATQDLGCTYCGNHFDVHAFDEKLRDTADQEYFETTVYTCPQCGGELIGADTEAAVFCSYCGSSNILESRLSREKRPKKIIPFQITKEECKKRFTEKVRKTGFAPKELLDPEVIESFRGIYMPYWAYTVEQHGDVAVKSEYTYQKGNYRITDRYENKGRLDAGYEGYAKDSASSFDDEISNSIAPYEQAQAVEFSPAYLSGFYADLSDVGEEIYETDARSLANRESEHRIRETLKRTPGVKGSIEQKFTDKTLHTEVTDVENVMYPVWFFSYRLGERISYAAINGQTGKIMADVPISKRRYYLSSLLFALPLFLLYNLLFTFRPRVTLGISMFFAVLTFVMVWWTRDDIVKKENHSEDKGWQSRQISETGKKPGKAKKGKAKHGAAPAAKDYLPILAAVFGGLVLFLNPVSDLWYYGCVLVILFTVLFEILGLIDCFNLVATRKLPQFEREGGDDRA